ncbi:MAG: hypothetical protein AB7N54_17990 [Alphaproteobacteria bacterium]
MADNFPIQQSLYLALGELTFSWALIDQSLDFWTTIIYQAAGGEHVEPEIPEQFSRKRRFLSRCFRQLDILAPYRTEAVAMLDEARSLATIRDPVTHGAYQSYDAQSDVIVFVGIKPTDKARRMVRTVEYRITLSRLVAAGGDAIDLTGRMLQFSNRLLDEVVPKDFSRQLLGGL